MPDSIKARMRCGKVTVYPYGSDGGRVQEHVELKAVVSSDPNDPNYSYSEATPSADLSMVIDNPGAQGFIRPGVEYDILITPRSDTEADAR